MKFSVGIMLIAYGTFWGGESTGVAWPGGELAILGLLAFYVATAWALVLLVRRRHAAPLVTGAAT